MKTKQYKTPDCQVINMELESAILSDSGGSNGTMDDIIQGGIW